MSDLSRVLDWVDENPDTVQTVANIFSRDTQPREVIAGTPTAGSPEGRDESNVNNVVQRGADVITQGKNLWDQAKGLFGLGYPSTETQPVSPIEHEVTPADLPTPTADGTPIKTGFDMKMLAIVGGIVVAIMLLKK